MKLFLSIGIIFIFFSSALYSQEFENDSLNFDASFPGGERALSNFIKDNMIIPESCLNEGKSGFVFVRFTIDTLGNLRDIVIDSNDTKCIDYELEAKRLVQLMPKWIPGKVNGKPVKISYLLPLDFMFTPADVPEQKTKYFEPNWAGIEFGITQLVNSSFAPTFNDNRYWENIVERSWVFNYNFLEYKVPLIKQFLGLTAGLGYSWRGIGFTNIYQLTANSDTVFAISTPVELSRNKLTAHHLTLPLILEFCTQRNTEKNFYFATGIIGSWRFSGYSYQKGNDLNGNKFSHYTYSNYNLSRFTLDLALRLGYSYFGIFANYQLNTLFQKDKTVAVHPFRLGLTINMDYFQE
jgi:hypothetical protein